MSAPAFADAAHPTDDELRAWAVGGKSAPQEGWDLVIAASTPPRDALILALASEAKGSKKRFFLRVLYHLTADAVYGNVAPERVQALIAGAATVKNPRVKTWGKRAAELLADPSAFHQMTWLNYADE